MTQLKLTKGKEHVKRNNDVLLITGDGKTLPDDVHLFYSFNVPHDVMCIGRSIKVVNSDILHYADIDADEGKWVAENLHKNNPTKINGNLIKHTIGEVDWFDVGWDLEKDQINGNDTSWYGSTALFAMLIGLEMGYKRIVLAGCPLDSKGHWYFPEQRFGPKWEAETYQVWFEFAETEMKENVRSMSGYTKTLLNTPDKDFFNGISKRTITN
jgi:hypothetical protein